jgi:hypothetical protein
MVIGLITPKVLIVVLEYGVKFKTDAEKFNLGLEFRLSIDPELTIMGCEPVVV